MTTETTTITFKAHSQRYTQALRNDRHATTTIAIIRNGNQPVAAPARIQSDGRVRYDWHRQVKLTEAKNHHDKAGMITGLRRALASEWMQ